MAKAMTLATAIVTSATVIAFYGAAIAQTGTTTKTPAKTPAQTDFDACNREAQMSGSTGGSASPGTSGTSGSVGAGAAAGGGTSGGSTLGSSGAGSTASGESQLRGMASAGASSPAYQQAYRDCMTKRGF
jgi:hypothetical protein